MNLIKCKKCGINAQHHGKGLCFNCYRKFAWVKKLVTCKHCGKEKLHQGKGYCPNCYNKIFRYDSIKEANYVKYHKIPIELYKEVTKKCMVCGFSKIIDLHHLDHNKKNNDKSNLIGLCPNHHKMLHDYRFSEEVVKTLEAKGFKAKLTKF
ncbi:HNH endonuclease [Candidatus Woesearchaeota archaeon]|nr:HNH endonuclease [Candidatus Woesearchaeota archaeon]